MFAKSNCIVWIPSFFVNMNFNITIITNWHRSDLNHRQAANAFHANIKLKAHSHINSNTVWPVSASLLLKVTILIDNMQLQGMGSQFIRRWWQNKLLLD